MFIYAGVVYYSLRPALNSPDHLPCLLLRERERERERERDLPSACIGQLCILKECRSRLFCVLCVPFTSLLLVVDIVSCLRLFRRQNKGALSSKCSSVEKSTLQAPAPKFEGGHTSYGRSVLRIASVGPVSEEWNRIARCGSVDLLNLVGQRRCLAAEFTEEAAGTMTTTYRAVLFLLVVTLPQYWAVRPLEPSEVHVSKDNKLSPQAVVRVRDGSATPAFEQQSSIASASDNYTRRLLSGCGQGNPIDDCWRCDPNWRENRQALADCAIGFGKNAIGGKNGPIYVVTDDSDNDMINPAPGTLRYGALQDGPLWIIFSRNMNIRLKHELIVNSYKTIDGRGANVHIAGGGCITLQYVSNIIIHGVHIHDNKQTGPATIRSSPTHVGDRGRADGDGISIFGSHDVWVDHNFLSHCADGLVDVTEASTGVTISNNYFSNHDKVMLLGAHPGDTFDKAMQVTVAFNHFGPNLVERIPRCRYGYFHIVNNYYSPWLMYAIGGSENPTINSEGNFFSAGTFKEVTKRIPDDGSNIDGWQGWNWRSSGDIFADGAFFTDSGSTGGGKFYAKATSFSARPAAMVAQMTNDAGPLML